MKREIKYQVFSISNKIEHTIYQYETEAEARCQYDIMTKTDTIKTTKPNLIELQQVIVLSKVKNGKVEEVKQ